MPANEPGGPLADFDGEITDVNADAVARLDPQLGERLGGRHRLGMELPER